MYDFSIMIKNKEKLEEGLPNGVSKELPIGNGGVLLFFWLVIIKLMSTAQLRLLAYMNVFPPRSVIEVNEFKRLKVIELHSRGTLRYPKNIGRL
ncbi:hypothetical protein [Owenweeksia hongkongensis]|uniref:hypothetical protein n=1 Tax=Owenweeksia hongkongensis TaxID=253245 RepID=UPI003A926EE9